jgi:predicted nucleic acid-binding protein
MALLQHRIGIAPVRDLDQKVLPLLHVEYVDAALHRRGVNRLFRLDQRRISLVDAVSFEAMNAEGIADALALDTDFSHAGFRLIP